MKISMSLTKIVSNWEDNFSNLSGSISSLVCRLLLLFVYPLLFSFCVPFDVSFGVPFIVILVFSFLYFWCAFWCSFWCGFCRSFWFALYCSFWCTFWFVVPLCVPLTFIMNTIFFACKMFTLAQLPAPTPAPMLVQILAHMDPLRTLPWSLPWTVDTSLAGLTDGSKANESTVKVGREIECSDNNSIANGSTKNGAAEKVASVKDATGLFTGLRHENCASVFLKHKF